MVSVTKIVILAAFLFGIQHNQLILNQLDAKFFSKMPNTSFVGHFLKKWLMTSTQIYGLSVDLVRHIGCYNNQFQFLGFDHRLHVYVVGGLIQSNNNIQNLTHEIDAILPC